MTMERIEIEGGMLVGGHEGLDVWRTQQGIEKYAYDENNLVGLARETVALIRMATIPGGFAPVNYGASSTHTVQQDLGDPEPIEDAEALRHSAVRLLRAIRAAGLRHGDLTSRNLIVREGGGELLAIDWQESHRLVEPAPQKSPYTDSALLMRYLADQPDQQGVADSPRIARRWAAVLADLGAVEHRDANPLPLRGRTFVDLGCFQGDFPALAACEGMHAIGIDQGGFRSGENSIAIGRARWAGDWEAIGGSLRLEQDNLIDLKGEAEVAVCFSTWPYMVIDFGRDRAEAWLRDVIGSTDVLYFETQLHGDGPGPDFLPDLASVADMLLRLGADVVVPIVSIPVMGRPAERTVWMVR